MRAIARIVSRALFATALLLLVAAAVIAGISIYVGSWPLRRAARRDGTGGMIVAQELLVAVTAAVTAFRARS